MTRITREWNMTNRMMGFVLRTNDATIAVLNGMWLGTDRSEALAGIADINARRTASGLPAIRV